MCVKLVSAHVLHVYLYWHDGGAQRQRASIVCPYCGHCGDLYDDVNDDCTAFGPSIANGRPHGSVPLGTKPGHRGVGA